MAPITINVVDLVDFIDNLFKELRFRVDSTLSFACIQSHKQSSNLTFDYHLNITKHNRPF